MLRVRNWRDLGGLPSRSAPLEVKRRSFFRSSTPARFAPPEQTALASLQLRCVVDLRTQAEVVQSCSVAATCGARLLHIPLFDAARPNWLAPADQTPQATGARYFEMLHDGLEALRLMVTEVAQADNSPFLVACTAGRDRTGIVVACLLDLLDVKDEAIAADYAASDPFDPDTGRAHAGTMLELLRLVRDRYGSVARMLQSGGLAEGVVESLRLQLLVPRM